MDLLEVRDNKNRHPWEISRASRIIKEISPKKNMYILDIGCGDGYFDEQLAKKYPYAHIYAIDIKLDHPRKEKNITYINSYDDIPTIPFDYILLMDILEHIKDDQTFLQDVVKRLSRTGKIIITVPAFMKLYSAHDKEVKHYRRYEHHSLKNVIKASGLKEEKWSYFYISLIAARMLTKQKTLNMKGCHSISGWQHGRYNPLTILFSGILNADYTMLLFLSKYGLNLPGLSLLSVCKKQE